MAGHFQFLDQRREEPDKLPLAQRRIRFAEVSAGYLPEVASRQAARCLECGSPYCEWKCPVHNYIPDWLRLAREGRIIEAV